jgi:hypothetical protein
MSILAATMSVQISMHPLFENSETSEAEFASQPMWWNADFIGACC